MMLTCGTRGMRARSSGRIGLQSGSAIAVACYVDPNYGASGLAGKTEKAHSRACSGEVAATRAHSPGDADEADRRHSVVAVGADVIGLAARRVGPIRGRSQ